MFESNIPLPVKAFERYQKEARLVAADLEQTYAQIMEHLQQDDKITPQDLLRQHRNMQESVIHVPERTIMQGKGCQGYHCSPLYVEYDKGLVSDVIQ